MINKLNEVLDKKGPKYVNDYLNDNNCVITEKLDTYRILFEKKGNDYIFYKKDNTVIGLIERLLNDVYESAIQDIPIITSQANIPENYIFGLYYTPVYKPIRLEYNRLPRYILTDINIKHENRITETLSYDKVIEWSSELCMGRPPIIYEGKLTQHQIDTLLSYDIKDFSNNQKSFSSMIKDLFGKTYSNEQIIEGIIIQSRGKLSQIISYEFDLITENYQNYNSRDFYDIVILDINAFLNKYNIPVLENLDDNYEINYVNLINIIFNDYINYRNLNNLDEKYLYPPSYGYFGKLNKSLIKNKKTLDIVNSSIVYESLYRIFISSFRKEKKPYGLLSEEIVNNLNSFIRIINSYAKNFKDNVNEARSENIVINKIKEYTPSDIDNMRVISSIQRAFEPSLESKKIGEQRCAVYITSFSPFSVSQYDNVVKIYKKWNVPVVLCAVSNKYKVKGKEFHPSENLIHSQMKSLGLDNEFIKGMAIIDSWDIKDIFQYCRPMFEPIVIITDENLKSQLALQLFFEEEIMGGRLNVDVNFNIGEMPNENKIQIIRAIEDNDTSSVLNLTPKSVHSIINNIISEYRLWSGQVLK